jgi:phenylalanyl-tRNA synthetase alpha chain
LKMTGIILQLNLPNTIRRDMQDTFSYRLIQIFCCVRIRHPFKCGMEENKPPIRTISPGRVFRNEAVSSVHVYFTK